MEIDAGRGSRAPIRIHRDVEVPPRRQIALRLEARIRDGGYQEGARLPSVRALGQRLGVHRETVAAAYRELARQGLVDTVPGSGVYVTSPEPVLARTLGPRDGALAMRLASLSAAIEMRRVLLLSEERALGEVIGRELEVAIPGIRLRFEPPPVKPCPGVHFGWLPIRVARSGSTDLANSHAGDSVSSPSLRPIPLRASLSEFDLKVLSTLRFPAVVGILSGSASVRAMIREAVRAGAGPEVGVACASPDEGAAMRRLRARATILTWDSLTASGVPRISGRRHLLVRLVPEGFVDDLLGLLGDSRNRAGRRRESTDRIRAGAS
ncbi:MAG: winged helix-turn-helix domain-containing protein, partial [marine benthic group bacterium]|nr:winged helix-turn-helix domain-containing protein [Gemmatimonadota bacterium]